MSHVRMAYFVTVFAIYLVFFSINGCLSLKYSIKENNNVVVNSFKVRVHKRDISELFSAAFYSFRGFEKMESVPILFPLDICVLKVKQVRHAACLHLDQRGNKKFVIFRVRNGFYERLMELHTPLAIKMDCKAFEDKGFVALAYNLTTPVEQADQGSPVFQIEADRVRPVQYFGFSNLRSVYFKAGAHDLFLLQIFDNNIHSGHKLMCPYFKWSGYSFNKVGEIPCSNARHLEPFTINTENFIAVANYADQQGHTETNSEIYKYDREQKELILFQKIKTNGAVDVKYFNVPFQEVKRCHFLIFANSLGVSHSQDDNFQADSVIYKYEKGIFIPYQMLSLYSVQKFLPVQNIELEKFILLVACSNQDVKVFNFNDWKFEMSRVQYTEGALGKGVSNMRIYEESGKSYLVIANERMMEKETNIFLPIFTKEEHTNNLRQKIIDWMVATNTRLNSINVEKLKDDLLSVVAQREKKVLDTSEIPYANVEVAYTRSLTYQQRNLTSSYWTTLSNVNHALETLQDQFKNKYLMKRHSTPDSQSQYVDDAFTVGTLYVRNNLRAQRINKINPKNPQFNTIAANKVEINENLGRTFSAKGKSSEPSEFLEGFNFKNLYLSGKINNIKWNDLLTNTLKVAGHQRFHAPASITSLRTDVLTSKSEFVNERNVKKLVSIDSGIYTIDQDLLFLKPTYAKDLTVDERLNNVPVTEGKLEVLLTNSATTQYITGKKIFQNVELQEPVSVSGRLLGQLELMSPFKTFHESLTLSGDYNITGDVRIQSYLRVNNIHTGSRRNNLKQVLDQGLNIFKPLEGLKLNFQKPIVATEARLTFVNGHDLRYLAEDEPNEKQIITGYKTIKNDLTISQGATDVKIINNIPVEYLRQEIFSSSGFQNITGNFMFKKAVARRITSPSLRLRGQDISNFLTKTETQMSEGNLKVQILKTQYARFGDLHTENKVFGVQLHSLSYTNVEPNPDIFNNFSGTINVQNLKVDGHINGVMVTEIERLISQLSSNIKYVGKMKLPKDLNMTSLTFTGQLNGISADEFGSCWLQRHGEQIFTAPQVLSQLSSTLGIRLEGTLNGYTLNEYISGTYWVNRDEEMIKPIFDIIQTNSISSELVNGLRIPDDILLSESNSPQILDDELISLKDVHVNGLIRKISTVNDINLAKLTAFFENDLDTLTVEHVNLEVPPTFITLNGRNLIETLDSVWLANADVDLQHHGEISEGCFMGYVDLQGPINGVNLNYLKENYFSLSRPQNVSAEVIFSTKVTFESTFNIDDLYVFGTINEATSNSKFHFNDFVQNTLLKSVSQTITGQWKIFKGHISGDLINVQINNLNLAKDVLLVDKTDQVVTSPKYIRSGSIENLICQEGSTINGENVVEWLRDAVLFNEDYAIQGKTRIKSIVVQGDINVEGTINNITFNSQNLLLRTEDQIITRNVKIESPNGNQMSESTFENLNVLTVNGHNIQTLLSASNQFKDRKITLKGSVTFKHPVTARNFESRSHQIDTQQLTKYFNSMRDRTNQAFSQLDEAMKCLQHHYMNKKYYISHFEQRQVLSIQAKKVISLTLKIHGELVDVIGILQNSDGDELVFLRWDPYHQEFVPDESLAWLPRRKALIDIFRVALGKAEYLAKETSLGRGFYHNVISTQTGGLQEIFKENDATSIEALELDDKQCLVVYKEVPGILSLHCLKLGEALSFTRVNELWRPGVLQVVSLERDYVALLLSDSVEIWNPNKSERPVQGIPILNPTQMAAIVLNQNTIYIAICSRTRTKAFDHGVVHIFRAQSGDEFHQLQAIDIDDPYQVEFGAITETNDVLLYILTESFNEPLLIYKYSGVVGFQPSVTSSTLNPTLTVNDVYLKHNQQHFIAAISQNELTFVHVVLSES